MSLFGVKYDETTANCDAWSPFTHSRILMITAGDGKNSYHDLGATFSHYATEKNWDPDTFPVEEIKRAIVTYLLSSLRDPMTQVNGFKVILDVKCNPIKYLRHATPSNLHLIYHAAQ
ncbi:hypothetical protein AVEN_228012-1, partial [Araneus ventricosus]